MYTIEKEGVFSMKRLITFLIVLGLISLFANSASAHVTVQPKETTQGSYELFTVRVPSEKDGTATTTIKVDIPKEVNITRFEPKFGWKYTIEKDSEEKITSVTWTTEGDGLSSTEFGQFNMQGKVGDDVKEIVWKAHQTYKDGSVVEWVGAADSEKPASVTTVTAADTTGGHEATTTKDQKQSETKTEQTKEASTESTTASNTPVYLSIAAFLVGLLSLGLSLKKRA
jgi:uncharacterized protein YcnI